MMKEFISNIVLFCISFFILEKVFFLLILYSPTLEVDKRLEMVLKGNIEKEIIVLGSSRGARDIIANQLESEIGLSAYNLSYPGSDIEFHEYVLRTLIKFNEPPKFLILAIDVVSEISPSESIKFRLDRLYPLIKYDFVNQEMINRGEKSKLSWFFSLARINKRNFDVRPKKFAALDTLMSCGSMPISFQRKKITFDYKQKHREYLIENELEYKKKLYSKIQKICSQNNIDLIICFPPNYKSHNVPFENRMRDLSNPETKLFVYDTLKQEYKNKNYFYDSGHLKLNGAKIFTHELSNYVNKIVNNQQN